MGVLEVGGPTFHPMRCLSPDSTGGHATTILKKRSCHQSWWATKKLVPCPGESTGTGTHEWARISLLSLSPLPHSGGVCDTRSVSHMLVLYVIYYADTVGILWLAAFAAAALCCLRSTIYTVACCCVMKKRSCKTLIFVRENSKKPAFFSNFPLFLSCLVFTQRCRYWSPRFGVARKGLPRFIPTSQLLPIYPDLRSLTIFSGMPELFRFVPVCSDVFDFFQFIRESANRILVIVL